MKNFFIHKETYNINGKNYEAEAHFNTNKLYLRGTHTFLKFPLDEYTEFHGNMRDFVKSKVGE